MKQKKLIEDFTKAFELGSVCLHPTETLPGFSFNPESKKAKENLYLLKGRAPEKTSISLVASLEKAKKFWEPLPHKWNRALSRLWPAPLSVIWKASDRAPACLVSQEKLIALRCPKFLPESGWMSDVLEALTVPFPSTSVNSSGESSCQTWQEALDFCDDKFVVFIPKLDPDPSFFEKPSTLILIEGASFKILREGALDCDLIRKALEE